MEMNIHAITNTFGLNQGEAEVFEYLLEFGSIKAVDLRKNLHLDRAPFYRTLMGLEAKNLIVIDGSLRKQTVKLQNIDSISNSLKLKKQEIEGAEKAIMTLVANMKELRDGRYHRDNMEIFSGQDAYLKSMQSILMGGGKILRDLTPDSAMLYVMAGSRSRYESIVQAIRKERLKKKINIRILFDNQAKNIDTYSASDTTTLKESRIFPKNLKLDCYMNICGSRTLFYTKDATGSWGIVLKDPLIASLLASLFDVIWDLSREL